MKSGRYCDSFAGVTGTRSLGWRTLRVALAAAIVSAAGLSPFVEAAHAQTPAAKPATQGKAAAKKLKKTQGDAARQAKAREASQKRESKGFVDTLLEGPRITTTPPEAADWVRASRPDPTAPRRAAAPPPPGRPLLSTEQIRAKEAELENLRARHDKIAGRKSPTGKFGSAAGKPDTPEAEKYKPGCVLTCATPIGVSRAQRR